MSHLLDRIKSLKRHGIAENYGNGKTKKLRGQSRPTDRCLPVTTWSDDLEIQLLAEKPKTSLKKIVRKNCSTVIRANIKSIIIVVQE